MSKQELITPPTGKGWGDGSLVILHSQNRRVNPDNTYTGFRPRIQVEGAYFVIRDWCYDPRIRRSFSALLNSLMLPLKTACEHTTIKDADGRISIELNCGRIYIE